MKVNWNVKERKDLIVWDSGMEEYEYYQKVAKRWWDMGVRSVEVMAELLGIDSEYMIMILDNAGVGDRGFYDRWSMRVYGMKW